jgi:large subunit ribosomal protein L30
MAEEKASPKKAVKKAATPKPKSAVKKVAKAAPKAAVKKAVKSTESAVVKSATKPAAETVVKTATRAVDKSVKKISLTLIRSKHGRLAAHKACVAGLGLRRMHQTVEVIDTPENRGMINKVHYLLKVEEA